MFLSPITQGTLILPRTSFDAKESFKIRHGHRWSSDNKTNKILPLATPQAEVSEIKTCYRTLQTPTSEWDIMEEFPECVYNDINVLLPHMCSLAALQSKGESEGDLVVDGYKANLCFFVPNPDEPCVGFVVRAGWDSVDSEWFFYANPLDGYVWSAGGRVFGNC